mmetsp:Transcript_35255/g.74444  ORF Transcript_35255/g.74444 Transcript_35255/m.74444 type:complete len:104 (-) Transcript_35255:98-409(-)
MMTTAIILLHLHVIVKNVKMRSLGGLRGLRRKMTITSVRTALSMTMRTKVLFYRGQLMTEIEAKVLRKVRHVWSKIFDSGPCSLDMRDNMVLSFLMLSSRKPQ